MDEGLRKTETVLKSLNVLLHYIQNAIIAGGWMTDDYKDLTLIQLSINANQTTPSSSDKDKK